MTKSEAVRQVMADGIEKPADIASEVAKRFGLMISPQAISVLKYQWSRKGKPSRGRGRPRKQQAAKPATNGVTYDDLLAAKAVCDRLGGIDKTRRALEQLESLLA